MKKSEMEKVLLNGLCGLGQWYHEPPELVARALSLLLQPKEGWEPEEPVLPKRLVLIEVGEDGLGDPPYRFLVPAERSFNSREDQRLAYRAAIDAYNERDAFRKKLDNVQRYSDRHDQLLDRWKRVVERALAEARSATPSFERILAILEERA